MAASRFFLYNTAVKRILQGVIDLDGSTIVAVPVNRNYTPSTASHSAFAQVSGSQSTASGSLVAAITLSSLSVDNSGAVATKFDTADIAGFSAGGDTFQTKYVVLYARSASIGGIDNPLIGWMDVDTASTTGIEATQLNVTVASGGWFKANSNSG